MKVRNTLIFILIIFAVIAGVMAVFPKDGIRIGDSFVLKCPSFEDFWSSSAKDESSVDLDSLLSSQINIDEHIPEKTPAKLKDMPEYVEQPDPTSDNVVTDDASNYNIEDIKSAVNPLEMPAGNSTALDNFFRKLAHHGEYEKI